MRFLFQSPLWFVAIFALLTGCGEKPKDHALPKPPRISPCEPGKPGGSLSLAVLGNPRTFNPVFAIDTASDAVVRMLFSSLVNVNMEAQEAEPGLAESWSVAPDGKTWTFKLRKNLRWSDGEPLTADDVVFTWNDVMSNPNFNPMIYDLFRAHGKNFEVIKIDDVTVRVVTPEIFAPFLEYFGSVVIILPKHVLGQAVKENRFANAYAANDGADPQKIVGSGPFRLKEFQPGKLVRLERNPEFWSVDKQGQRLPYFEEVRFTVVTNPAVLQSLFLDGTSAAFESIRSEEWETFRQASADGRFRLIDLGAGVQRDVFWFNQNTNVDAAGKPLVSPAKLKWFRDRKFRQAISWAINRERIVNEVYGGRAQVIYNFLSSDNKKWNNPAVASYGFDPDKARALLAEIGMTSHSDGMLRDVDGNVVEFTLISSLENPARGKIAAMIQADLKKVGIRLNYQPVDFQNLVRKINGTLDYESALMGLGGGGIDPASQMNVLKSDASLHQWFPSQKKPSTEWEAKLDLLMDAQMRTSDFAQRKKFFDAAQAIWADEQPMICIAAPSTGAAIRSNIGNVRPSIAPVNHVTWNIEELYFKN